MRGTEGVEELGKKFLYPLKTLKKGTGGVLFEKSPPKTPQNLLKRER